MRKQLTLDEIRFNAILLTLICRASTNSMSEAQIIALGEKTGWLTHQELCSVQSRVDSRFANMIHRVAYHRDSKRNPINLGLIRWDPTASEFTATEKGIAFLGKVEKMLSSQTVDAWLRQLVKDENAKGGHS